MSTEPKLTELSSAITPLQVALHSRWQNIKTLREICNKGSLPDPELDTQGFVKLTNSLQTEYIICLLLSHGLCEALINSTIAVALGKIGNPELFAICERADFLEKWTNALKIASPTYSIDKSSAVFETLKRLNAQRSYYLHNKAEVSFDGRLVFSGTKGKHGSFSSDLDWIERYVSLPHDLASHLMRYSQLHLPAVILLDRDPIPQAPQHKP